MEVACYHYDKCRHKARKECSYIVPYSVHSPLDHTFMGLPHTWANCPHHGSTYYNYVMIMEVFNIHILRAYYKYGRKGKQKNVSKQEGPKFYLLGKADLQLIIDTVRKMDSFGFLVENTIKKGEEDGKKKS